MRAVCTVKLKIARKVWNTWNPRNPWNARSRQNSSEFMNRGSAQLSEQLWIEGQARHESRHREDSAESMNRGSAQLAGHESRGKPGMNRGTGRPVQSPWIEGQAGHESRICPACLQAEQQWSWIEEESPMNRGADQAWIEGLPSLPCYAFCSPSYMFC